MIKNIVVEEDQRIDVATIMAGREVEPTNASLFRDSFDTLETVSHDLQ